MSNQKTVWVEFIGKEQQSITYRGPSGCEYRVGNNASQRFIEVLAEDAAYLLQFPEFRIATLLPAISATWSIPGEVSFVLNTNSHFLIKWLKGFTQSAYTQNFPTDRGHIALQGVVNTRFTGDRQIIEMPAYYVTPNDDGISEMAHPLSAAISIEIVALASERIEVLIACNQPAIFAYFRSLLKGIAELWPEAESSIHTFVTDNLRAELRLVHVETILSKEAPYINHTSSHTTQVKQVEAPISDAIRMVNKYLKSVPLHIGQVQLEGGHRFDLQTKGNADVGQVYLWPEADSTTELWLKPSSTLVEGSYGAEKSNDIRNQFAQELLRSLDSQIEQWKTPTEDAIPTSRKRSASIRPDNPDKGAGRDVWFRYKRDCDANGEKFTHNDLAKELSLSPGYVRQLYAIWLAGEAADEKA